MKSEYVSAGKGLSNQSKKNYTFEGFLATIAGLDTGVSCPFWLWPLFIPLYVLIVIGGVMAMNKERVMLHLMIVACGLLLADLCIYAAGWVVGILEFFIRTLS